MVTKVCYKQKTIQTKDQLFYTPTLLTAVILQTSCGLLPSGVMSTRTENISIIHNNSVCDLWHFKHVAFYLFVLSFLLKSATQSQRSKVIPVTCVYLCEPCRNQCRIPPTSSDTTVCVHTAVPATWLPGCRAASLMSPLSTIIPWPCTATVPSAPHRTQSVRPSEEQSSTFSVCFTDTNTHRLK